jgi:hypothetical protein
MGIEDWNWKLPTDLQDYPWDCAACSLAWCLRTVGLNYSEEDVINGLGPQRISPTLGLLDASGAGLVSFCAEIGVTAENNPAASWSDVVAAAGFQPMCIGGRAWNHWSGVRMGSIAVSRPDLDVIALMNPSPGWMQVGQSMIPAQFSSLGPFSAVWLTAW